MNEDSEEVTHNKQTSTVGSLLSGKTDQYMMQQCNMASIPEDSATTHSIESHELVVTVTSPPISIPGSITFNTVATSPTFSPGSFMLRRYSSPTLSGMNCKCGSSPIVCQSTSTQTPRKVHDGEGIDLSDDSDDSDDEVLLPVDPGDHVRSSSVSAVSRSAYPLPDLLEFRNRSHSEPAIRPEIEVGQELRRISDEFHLSYQECRVVQIAANERGASRQSYFWRLVSTIRRRASLTRGSSV